MTNVIESDYYDRFCAILATFTAENAIGFFDAKHFDQCAYNGILIEHAQVGERLGLVAFTELGTLYFAVQIDPNNGGEQIAFPSWEAACQAFLGAMWMRMQIVRNI